MVNYFFSLSPYLTVNQLYLNYKKLFLRQERVPHREHVVL